jgi:hypothetical protein
MNERIFSHLQPTYFDRWEKFLEELSIIPTEVLVYYYIHSKLPKEAYEYEVVMRIFCGWLNDPSTREAIKEELLYRFNKALLLLLK